ncbi:flagellar basal body rod protein [Bacillus sp. 165]|uniref:lmo0954 family membrane protein n=1 Tax=Bacillus sp. 165 TaxID=1529117 RepID=UPI001AD9BC03|nr:flagellar basal body rod protein [Bacillus sp. 165]MBO9128332.1 flagellar basal body rod protein [Bacillus sp. 165]
MKKFLTFLAAGVLVIIALASLGNLIALAIGVALAYWSIKSFLKSHSLLGKFSWGIVGLIGLSIVFGNFPAIIGIVAIALLYYGYRQWKNERGDKDADKAYKSFENFEEQWDSIMKQQ